jgi:NADH-quinone oxidoreductase subunit N
MLTWGPPALFLALALWIGTWVAGHASAFGGLFVDDAFSRFAKVVPSWFPSLPCW